MSFRAPPRGDTAAWALAERLVKSGSIPEFKRARRGTLAHYWERNNRLCRGGLGCLEHTYEATWQQVWYPRHARELPEWIQFMMTTPVKPPGSPKYTKAQKQ